MKFYCDDHEYESTEMLCPPIKDDYVIAVFLTKDYARVYATYMFPDSGVGIRRIQGEVLTSLAERSGLQELAEAVKVENAKLETA